MKIIALLVILAMTGCTTSTDNNSVPVNGVSTSSNSIPAAMTDPAEYARILNLIDTNGDKSITAAEIRASGLDPGKSILFSQTNTVPTGQTPEKYIEIYDADYDKILSPAELKNYAYVFVFKDIDTNKDGFLQKEELLAHEMSSKTTDAEYAFMDANKDGKVSFEEFATTGERMQSQASNSGK